MGLHTSRVSRIAGPVAGVCAGRDATSPAEDSAIRNFRITANDGKTWKID